MTTRLRPISILLLLLGATLAVAAGEPAGSPAREEADTLYDAEDWVGAAQAYARITRDHPQDGTAWLRLGMAEKNRARYEEAIAALQRAEPAGAEPAEARYQLACVYALLADPEQAFAWLNRALQAGFGDESRLRSDPELVLLREDLRFASMADRARKNGRPCEHDARYRQLDFWVGQWNVFDSRGRPVGSNIILKALQGCMIFENWTSTSGRAGKSMNFFDPAIERWRQQWVADSGYIIRYVGELHDGAMHLEGENIARDGTVELSRMTLTPQEDGDVIQLIEQSRDGGKTWYVWFRGTYVPRFSGRGAPEGP